MSQKIKIAVDAMGGDFAPVEIVKGVIQAVRETDAEFILVGDEKRIMEELKDNPLRSRIEIIHTSEFISMQDSPTSAVKKKKDASMAIAARLTREGKASAMISAGNTGALMEVALLYIGRIQGIKRPAISTLWPVKTGRAMLIDSGANADCRPEHLLQFAQMGSIYCEKVLEISKPRIGLLNIGEEPGKGNNLVVNTYEILRQSGLNFCGNIEMSDFIEGSVDVAVCDGFVGNISLKTGETVASFLTQILKDAIRKKFVAKIGALFLKSVFNELKKKLDPSEYGGAPFLGVDGICIKSHGKANAYAIKNAVKLAMKAYESQYINKIKDHIGGVQKSKN